MSQRRKNNESFLVWFIYLSKVFLTTWISFHLLSLRLFFQFCNYHLKLNFCDFLFTRLHWFGLVFSFFFFFCFHYFINVSYFDTGSENNLSSEKFRQRKKLPRFPCSLEWKKRTSCTIVVAKREPWQKSLRKTEESSKLVVVTAVSNKVGQPMKNPPIKIHRIDANPWTIACHLRRVFKRHPSTRRIGLSP